MIKPNSSKQVWGLSLGSKSWAAECVDNESGKPIRQRFPSSNSSAPSLLLPRLSAESARLDIWAPCHVRGSGKTWPLESVVDGLVGSGRMPIAAAWTARNQVFLSENETAANPLWRWRIDGATRDLRPDEGVAEAMAQLSKWACHDSPIALTIPNNFRQSEQQSVIDRCKSLDVDATLLWSPIAAALVWLSRFELTLSNLPKSKRKLLHVHVDWGTIAYTEMQLVSEHESSSRQWLPARSRPRREDVKPGFGWYVEATAQKSQPLAKRWRRLIGAGNVNNSAAVCRPVDSTILKSIQKWETAYQDPIEHIHSFKQKLINESASYAGVVITGDFADFAFDGETTLSRVIDIYAPRIAEKSIVAAGVEGEKLLAKGAAVFASARQNDIVTYLDTLPALDLFVETEGQFEWLPLLGDKDVFVPGGQVWQRPDSIKGLAVRRGATAVRLVVAHEEFSGVREISAVLPETAEQRLSAELHVSAIAAQGNASLELNLSGQSELESIGKIRADWRRMKPILDDNGNPIDKDSYLKNQPRAFPELMPRKSSYSCWQRSQSSIQEFISRLNAPDRLVADVYLLRSLNQAVQQKDQTQYPNDATAIGSDFRCPGSQKALDELVEGLLQLWQKSNRRPSDGFSLIIRILGYLSVDNIEFENWLIENIRPQDVRRPLQDLSAIKHTFGLCARDPGNIGKFLSTIFAGRSAGTNDLKSASQILRYRAKATESMSTELCENILGVCLQIFERDMEKGGRTFAFRWSSLIVVYILRRRMFDPGFAEPDEKLAKRAKDLFSQAMQLSKSRKLRPLGGSVDLPSALQQMIDYIDKKGRGDILMAAEN